MPAFSQRHKGFKAGVVLLVLSAVMGTWGVIAPGWLRSEVAGSGSVYSDLWFINCQNGFSGCEPAQFNLADASMQTTRTLSCVGVVLVLCSSVLVLHHNCCSAQPSYGHAAPLLAFFAGLVLFISCMTYLGDSVDFMQDFASLHFGPSFILTLSSSLLAALAAGLLTLYNRPPALLFCSRYRAPSATMATMVQATAPMSSNSIQRLDCSVKPPQGRYGGYVVTQGAINSAYYGSQHVLCSAYQVTPQRR